MIDIKSQIIKPALNLEDLRVVASAEGWKLTDLHSLGFFLNRNFKYRRKITITEQSGSDLTDYQVLIELNSSNFDFSHTQTNGEDIRFTDASGNLLDYWIEEWDAVNESAKVWVKVPSIPANSSVEILMYYGNSEVVSASDGGATFEFFDDLEIWEGWVQYGSGQVSQDSTRYYEGQYSAHKTNANDPNGAYKDIGKTLGRGIALEFWVNRNSDYSGGAADRIGVIDDNGNGYGWAYLHDVDEISVDKRTNYAAYETTSSAPPDFMDKWVFARFIISSNEKIKSQRYVDGALNGEFEITDTSYSTFTRVYIFGGYDYWVDQIRIRKYASPEPTVDVEVEENV